MDWGWIVPIIYGIILIIRDIPNQRKYNKVTIPQQLVQLIQQAHKGESFETEWNISVSADMRERLCYPLKPIEVELIKATTYIPQENTFNYTLSSYKYNGHELVGTVLVTIKYRNDRQNINLEYNNVPIQIRCGGKGKPGNGWQVCSVEYL